ncbi:MAG: shikimate dehydrogenase [Actinomycetota bacterium]
MAGVIGDPVGHSLSPTIHNAAFDEAGLDWAYVALPVQAGRGAAAVDAMRTLDLGGLSVTMPHKADVVAAADRATGAVDDLAAANCLAWDGSDIVAHNTDGDGFLASLREAGVEPAGRRAVVLGAGGAARAVVRALDRAEATDVVVVNRTPARAEVAAAVGASARVGEIGEVADAPLVVNATSVGMGRPSDDPEAIPLRPTDLGAGQAVVDLVYQPVTTALLRAAADAGATPIDGVGMLVHQAALAFELWTGAEAPIAVMQAAARGAIGE